MSFKGKSKVNNYVPNSVQNKPSDDKKSKASVQSVVEADKTKKYKHEGCKPLKNKRKLYHPFFFYNEKDNLN